MSNTFLWIEDNHAVLNGEIPYLEYDFPDDKFVIVSSYDDAIKALTAMVEKRTLDAILSDFEYPGKKLATGASGMGGLDLLEYVREKGVNVPFALISGNESDYISDALTQRGLEPPDMIFQKPIGLIDIVPKVKQKFLEKRPENVRAASAAGNAAAFTPGEVTS